MNSTRSHFQLSSRHPPPPRSGSPPKSPFRPRFQQSSLQNSFKRYGGPIYLPSEIYKLMSKDAIEALNAYKTVATYRFHKRKVHDTDIVDKPQTVEPEPSESGSGPSDLPQPYLDFPEYHILRYIKRHCNSTEVLALALQAYQTYQSTLSHGPTVSPDWCCP